MGNFVIDWHAGNAVLAQSLTLLPTDASLPTLWFQHRHVRSQRCPVKYHEVAFLVEFSVRNGRKKTRRVRKTRKSTFTPFFSRRDSQPGESGRNDADAMASSGAAGMDPNGLIEVNADHVSRLGAPLARRRANRRVYVA